MFLVFWLLHSVCAQFSYFSIVSESWLAEGIVNPTSKGGGVANPHLPRGFDNLCRALIDDAFGKPGFVGTPPMLACASSASENYYAG
jgi:hypothetical protein